MVNNQDREIDLIFHALSDATRRSMLSRLARGELSVTELAEPYEISLAGVSKHLKVLEEARFVERTREGRVFRCKANLAPLDRVTALLEELGSYWRARLDSLERYFEQQNDNRKKTTGEKTWHKHNRNTKHRR